MNLRYTILWLTLFFTQASFAATYYISNSGNTTNSGTSTSATWSPAKLSSSWSVIQPGDQILFHRGETFPPIAIGKSGTASARIVMGAYGSGDKPLFSKLASLTSWVSVGNGRYEATLPSFTSRLNIVLLNGMAKPMGRFPNTGYLKISSTSGGDVTSADLPSTPNWKGGEMVLRTENWRTNRYTISAHSGSTVTVPATYFKIGYGFFIQNDVDALDLLGEWSYSGSKLTMFFGAASPSSYEVQVSTADSLIYAIGKSFVTLDNLSFLGANETPIDIRSGSNFIVQNCDINYSGIDGINATSHPNFTALNCTVLNSYNNGINMIYSGSTNPVIRGNIIKNTFYSAGMGQPENGNGMGLYIGTGGIAEYNQVINSGYVAIRFDGNNVTVKNNYIDTFCFIKDDGGGIYAWGPKPYAASSNRKVVGNIVLNGLGAPAGTSSTTSKAEGIYLDDNVNNIEITNNTVYNTHRGIYMHNNQYVNARGNLLYNNQMQVYFNDDDLGVALRNIQFVKNIAFSKTASQRIIEYNSSASDFGSMAAKMDSNYYCRPIDEPYDVIVSDGAIVKTTVAYGSSKYYSLYRWTLAYPNYDKNTKKTVKTITNTNELRFEYNNTNTSTSISLDGKTYVDHAGVAYTTNVLTLAPYSSKVLLITPGVPLSGSNTPPTVSLTSPVNNQQYTAPATILITANASDDIAISNVDFYSGNTLLFSDNTAPYSYSWTNVGSGQYNISAKAKDNTGLVSSSTTSSVVVNAPASAPSVVITSPANNASFIAPASINITATASDADGTVKKVDFYNGTTLIGSDTAAPYAFTWAGVAAGAYSMSVKATDNSGLSTTSGAISVSVVAGNKPPTVTLTSPINGGKYTAPATVTLSANASDADGSVAKVEFFNGSVLISTVTVPPYTFTWTNVVAGNYSITARATDNSGVSVTSAVATIAVSSAAFPKIALTSPINNASYTAPASIIITASASDSDGTVTSVRFYHGDTMLVALTTAPYTWTWSGVSAGTYTLTAQATDNSGLLSTSGAVTVIVKNPPSNIPPTISLSSPSSGAQYTAPASVNITATASDPDGTVAKVDFYNGNTLLFSDATTPYSYTWTGVAAGIYGISAKATDNSGAVTASSITTITVNPPLKYPSVALATPANNSVYTAPASISISATASDADGSIAKVEFYNGTSLLSSDATSPYSYSWTGVPAGSYTITAKATDNDGLTTTSGITNITVNAVPNVKPAVSITSPANNSTFTQPGNMTIAATATDADGVVKAVKFYSNENLLFTSANPPYSYTFNSIPVGVYDFKAVAIDDKGDSTVSEIVRTTIVAANQPPSVSISIPANNTQFVSGATVNITVNATDNDGVVNSVKIYNGATLLTTLSAAPYTFSWTNVAVGSYSITAVATDDKGLSTTSSLVSISVRGLVSPVANITAPENNTFYLAPATFVMTATASDPDGSVKKVEFYRGSVLLGTDTSSPYSVQVSGLAAGSYVLTVKAYDDDNLVTTSAAVSIVVNAPKVAPSVSVTAPANNATFGDTVAIVISATAADADGSVSRVDFYGNGEYIASDYAAPYSISWTNMAAGTYSIIARAVDNDSLVTTSAPRTVKIVHVNIAPTIRIISPASNASFLKNDPIYINVAAADVDGTVTKVSYYADGSLIGSSTLQPFNFTWKTKTPGSYVITAKVADDSGAATVSNPITVAILAEPTKVSGSAQIIILP